MNTQKLIDEAADMERQIRAHDAETASAGASREPQAPLARCALATGSPASKRRDSQCECCASPLGKELTMEHTKRVICDQCLGFVARWIIELEQENDGDVERRGQKTL